VLPALFIVVFASMAVEARRASRNERTQLERGGVEPPHDVFTIMRIAYPAAFFLMFLEGLARGGASARAFWIGLALFAAAKALKWWAIVSLGPFWTFRVIVVPGAPLVVKGPYRLMRHPNYVGVVGELVGTALFTGAAIFGPLGVAVFGVLIFRRVGIEERALRPAAG
jgi:methyltransferase